MQDAVSRAAAPAGLPSGAAAGVVVREEPGAVADGDEREVELARRGDEDAFDRLVGRHQAGVARLLWRFSRDPDEHEELLGEVFLAAWESLGSWRGAGSFDRWLRGIAVRCGYDLWRRRGRERVEFTDTIEELADQVAAVNDETEAVVAADLLSRVLARVSPRDRLVLTLLYLEELSVKEIAELTGWSPSLVKVQAWRARGRVRTLCAGDES